MVAEAVAEVALEPALAPELGHEPAPEHVAAAEPDNATEGKKESQSTSKT